MGAAHPAMPTQSPTINPRTDHVTSLLHFFIDPTSPVVHVEIMTDGSSKSAT
jgi:hypothetical protein